MSHLYGKGGRLLGIFLLVVLAVGGLVIFAKAEGPTEGALTIYSGRREVFMKPLMDDFQKRTGVKLSVKYGRVGELANTIILEKENPVADIFLTTEPATLEALRRRGLLQGYVSPNAAPIPALYKDPDGTWTGLVGRVRVIMHNKNLIKEEALPKSLFELTDPKWKGKVAMASTQERSVLLWLASIVALKGDNFARDYFKGLAANVKVLSGHTEVRQAVGRGEFQIGLVNHYYYLQEKKEGSPVGIYYPDQGPDDIGVLVFPSAIAIVKGTKHPKAAQAFTDFMLSEKMRSELAQEIGEIPLTVAAQPAGLEELRPLEQLRQTPVTIPQLTDLFEKTLKLVEPYGF